MNARFSSNPFEPSPNLAEQHDPAHETAHDAALAGLVPAAARDVMTVPAADEASEPGRLTESITDRTDEGAGRLDDVFVPDHYESNYAYPLLVWLQTTTWPRAGFERIMRMVSERNYIGVALPIAAADRIQEQLQETVARLRRRFHLHTERVFLVGIGEAGTQALATGLSQPDWFGGVAALSSAWPATPRLLARYEELRRKRVLLAVDDRDDETLVDGVERARKLLWTAGMHVTRISCSNAGKTCPGLFRELDRWLMQAIEQPELVS